jgi:hypothetical protein
MRLQKVLKKRLKSKKATGLTVAFVSPAFAGWVYLVPGRELESPHLAIHGPEPCASTNSATRAQPAVYHYRIDFLDRAPKNFSHGASFRAHDGQPIFLPHKAKTGTVNFAQAACQRQNSLHN